MKDVKVTCDGCQRDLTTTANSEAHRLALASERVPSRGGNMRCLVAWLKATPAEER